MRQFIANLRSEEGATAAEYVFLIVFVAIIASAGMFLLGGDLSGAFSETGDAIEGVAPGTPGG